MASWHPPTENSMGAPKRGIKILCLGTNTGQKVFFLKCSKRRLEILSFPPPPALKRVKTAEPSLKRCDEHCHRLLPGYLQNAALRNKARLRDLIAAPDLVILLKLDSNHWFSARMIYNFDGWHRKTVEHHSSRAQLEPEKIKICCT